VVTSEIKLKQNSYVSVLFSFTSNVTIALII